MPVVVPRYTLQDLESFPDDGNRYELLDGILLVTPAPAPLHQLVAPRIASALSAYLGNDGPARVFCGGTVEVEPNLHLEPDVLVVPVGAIPPLKADTRWTAIRKWWLAVEVSGPGSRTYDRDFKGPAYLALGILEVWRVDLREKVVFVSRPGAAERRHEDTVTWHPPGMPEPLTISIPGLFVT